MAMRLLTTGQAARRFSVTPDAILRWIRSGRLPAERTPGGHFRIQPTDLERLRPRQPKPRHIYCWELRGRGAITTECRSCVVYRTRGLRCYELRRLAPDSGMPPLACSSSCKHCDYHRKLSGRAPNVLVVTENAALSTALQRDMLWSPFNLRVAEGDYELSELVESFRPDFAVIDEAFDPARGRRTARLLLRDHRTRLVRVILAVEASAPMPECDPEIFARITKPFGIEQIESCIRGIRTAHPRPSR